MHMSEFSAAKIWYYSSNKLIKHYARMQQNAAFST